jgi:hypothetical protein
MFKMQIVDLRKQIEADQHLLLQWSEEKQSLAHIAYSMLEEHILRLEQDKAALSQELEVRANGSTPAVRTLSIHLRLYKYGTPPVCAHAVHLRGIHMQYTSSLHMCTTPAVRTLELQLRLYKCGTPPACPHAVQLRYIHMKNTSGLHMLQYPLGTPGDFVVRCQKWNR